MRDDKRGAIPADMQPIFQRMGLNQEEWLEIVQNFGQRYRRAAVLHRLTGVDRSTPSERPGFMPFFPRSAI